MPSNYYTPSDRDYLIRTMLGEAANEPDDGLAGVAHVVMNRVQRGFGRTPTEVVFAKNQFEPWSTRRDELLNIDPNSPAYKKAAAIADGVISGKIKDPTSGATHFLNEDVVRQRTGGTLPDWATGKSQKIGAHTFYYPGQQSASIADKYMKSGVAPVLSPETDKKVDDVTQSLQSLVDKYTKKTDLRPPGFPEGNYVQTAPDNVPLRLPDGPIQASPAPVQPTTAAGKLLEEGSIRIGKDLPKVGNALIRAPGNVLKTGANETVEGLDMMRQGGREMSSGEFLPTGKITDPSTWKPGGALRAAGGALRVAGGVTAITPLTEQVETGVTEMTGNPEAGARAGLVSNVWGPSAAATKLGNRLRPSVRASTKLAETPLSAEEQARLAANPRLTPMDVNPSIRAKAMGIYNEPGPGKNKLFDTVRQRADSAPEAVSEAYTAAAGPPVNVGEALRGFVQTAQDNARKGFGEAFKDAKPVNVTPVIEAIDSKLKPGVTGVASPGTTVQWGPLQHRLAELRNELTDGKSVVADPNRLHEIQFTLGREVRSLMKSATGSDHKLGSDLKKVQDQLVKQIDDATGGKYQPARAQFKTDMDVKDSFEKGFDLTRNAPGMKGALADSPDAWREWIAKASPEELEAAKLGARASIEQRIMGYRHSARRGTDIEDVPYNREKFQMLFGKKEADRLQQLLRDERDIATTNSKLIANSDTAERLSGKESVKVRDLHNTHPAASMLPFMAEIGTQAVTGQMGVGAAGGTAVLAARHVANRLGRRGDIARNNIMTDIITRGGQEGAAGMSQAMTTAAQQGNRLLSGMKQGRLYSPPAPPITYVPPDVRERRLVPLEKD